MALITFLNKIFFNIFLIFFQIKALSNSIAGVNIYDDISSKKIGQLYANSYSESLLFFNPGGCIPPENMSGFAQHLVNHNIAVLVLKYPCDLAINPFMADFAASVAEKIRKSQMLTLPSAYNYISKIPFNIAGHSLGAAILTYEIQRDRRIFEKAFLIGAKYFTSGFNTSSHLVPIAIIGEKDRTVNTNGTISFLERFDIQYSIVPEVNHFCIADDNAGLPPARAFDLPINITPDECKKRIAASIYEYIN